jgi:hypothetical protein
MKVPSINKANNHVSWLVLTEEFTSKKCSIVVRDNIRKPIEFGMTHQENMETFAKSYSISSTLKKLKLRSYLWWSDTFNNIKIVKKAKKYFMGFIKSLSWNLERHKLTWSTLM